MRGHKDIKEFPKSQRYLSRPSLEELFQRSISAEKRKRNRAIIEAVEKWGYSQKEAADYLGMHYSPISRLINKNNSITSKTRPPLHN